MKLKRPSSSCSLFCLKLLRPVNLILLSVMLVFVYANVTRCTVNNGVGLNQSNSFDGNNNNIIRFSPSKQHGNEWEEEEEEDAIPYEKVKRPKLKKINVVEPTNIVDILTSCRDSGVEKLTSTQYEELIRDSVLHKKSVLTQNEFICKSKCAIDEPELERTVRIMRIGDHSSYDVLYSCKQVETPLLIWITEQGEVKWLNCNPNKNDHLMGKAPFKESLRLLYILSKLVKLPELVVGFDSGDFVTPSWYAPLSKIAYMGPLAPIIHLVGTDAHYGLLFPTGSHIMAMAHCRFRSEEQWWRICTVSGYDKKWENRTSTFFWRGLPTGMYHDSSKLYTHRQRYNLMKLVGKLDGFDVGFVRESITKSDSVLFRFDPNEAKRIEEHWVQKPLVQKEEHSRYRYLIHVDGNSASWGISHKLASGSPVFWIKSSHDFKEYFYALLEPFKHYVPIGVDGSELISAKEWAFNNDLEAKKIGDNTLLLVKERLRAQDIYCYVYRLLLSVQASQNAKILLKHQNLPLKDIIFNELGKEMFNSFSTAKEFAGFEKL